MNRVLTPALAAVVAVAPRRGTGSGTISSRLSPLEPEGRRRLVDKVDRLLEWIGLIGPRVLVPVMADLAVQRQPTLLTAEGLAVALVTDGTICVTVDSPLLRGAVETTGATFGINGGSTTAPGSCRANPTGRPG